MYETLANRYRPQTLEDVVEQDVVKKTLKHQIEKAHFQHAMLFSGCPGTGKTSNARIFARAINGGSGAYTEINAAVRNKVEDIRDLVEEAQFAPLGAKYRVYIVDECHMLTIQAWNAFLKLLEEPPKHAIFILCTTDPQKIPDTILSRTQRYEFKRISFKGIVDRLEYVLNCEKSGQNLSGVESWDKSALEYIAKSSKGGMRSALTLLDKCLAYSPILTAESVAKVAGVADCAQMIELLKTVQEKNETGCLALFSKLYDSSVDFKQFIKDFIAFVLDVIKYCQTKSFELLEYIPDTFKSELESFSDIIFLREVLTQLMELSSDLKWETNPKMLIEATFVTKFFGE